MDTKTKLKNFLIKIQGYSEFQKKIIFFCVMGVATLGMLFLAFQFTKATIPNVASSLGAITFPAFDSTGFDFSTQASQSDSSQKDLSVVQDNSGDEVVDWKTYKSPELGFSMDYPVGMIPSMKATNGSIAVTFTSTVADSSIKSNIIRVCPKDCFAGKDFSKSDLFSKANDITIDGTPAKIYVSESDLQKTVFIYFLKSPTSKFNAVDPKNVATGGWFGAEFSDKSMVDHLVESFKFIN